MTVRVRDIHQFTDRTIFYSKSGITAYAGGGQANAIELDAHYNNISTVASANDSVKLMSGASVGTIQHVRNAGASALALYPPVGESFNQQAANAGMTMYAPNGALQYEGDIFSCWKVTATLWIVFTHTLINVSAVKLYQGAISVLDNLSVGGRILQYGHYHLPVSTITAYAGGGQANATALGAGFSHVTVVASANDSVKMPATAAIAGTIIYVSNAGANDVDIYPITDGQIDALGANNPYTLSAGSSATFISTSAANWRSFP